MKFVVYCFRYVFGEPSAVAVLCRGSGLVVFDGARWRVAQYVLSMLIPNAIAASVGRETVKALEQVGQ